MLVVVGVCLDWVVLGCEFDVGCVGFVCVDVVVVLVG